MNRKDLMAAGGFVSAEFLSREIEWNSPVKGKVKFKAFYKKPSYADIEAATNAQKEGVCSFGAFLVTRCVGLGDGGLEPFSVDDVRQLEPTLFDLLFKLVILPEPQKAGEEKKPSRRKTNSGTS